jgi:hypothetical protein
LVQIHVRFLTIGGIYKAERPSYVIMNMSNCEGCCISPLPIGQTPMAAPVEVSQWIQTTSDCFHPILTIYYTKISDKNTLC